MSSSKKKLTCKGTLWQVFICLKARTPYPSPPYTMYRCIQNTYSHREGGGIGGRVEPERRLEGQQFTKLARKYQSFNSVKHLPQFFLDVDICFGVYIVIQSMGLRIEDAERGFGYLSTYVPAPCYDDVYNSILPCPFPHSFPVVLNGGGGGTGGRGGAKHWKGGE